MFRIAICDDEPVICSQIEKIILNYGGKASLDIDVEVYSSGEELYQYLKESTYYDLIFLDIELNKLNGIDVGKKIRNEQQNDTTLIVYISAMENYSMDLFEIRPMHFLIKPLEAEVIVSVVEKAMELSNKYSRTFQYKRGHFIRKIEIRNILFFESMDRKVKMITLGGEETFYESLKNIFTHLEPQGFFYCHKSYLVNYHHISRFEYDQLVMENGTILPISQPKRKHVRNMQMRI